MPKDFKTKKKIVADSGQIWVGLLGYVFFVFAWYFTKDNQEHDINGLYSFVVIWTLHFLYRVICVVYRKRKLKR